MKGKLITFEGTDGAGKTTQINLLKEYLTEKGFDVVLTREPGGTTISEKIREILLDKNNTEMKDKTEVLLYAAARAQHVLEKIIPALNEGKIVISDRFFDSNIAYQGFGRGIGEETVFEINKFALCGIMPDLTFFLDASPKTGLKRKINEKNHTLDRMEKESETFHERVYEGFCTLCDKYPERIKRIDAIDDIESIHKKIIQQTEKIL